MTIPNHLRTSGKRASRDKDTHTPCREEKRSTVFLYSQHGVFLIKVLYDYPQRYHQRHAFRVDIFLPAIEMAGYLCLMPTASTNDLFYPCPICSDRQIRSILLLRKGQASIRLDLFRCLLIHVKAIAYTCMSNYLYMYKQSTRRGVGEEGCCLGLHRTTMGCAMTKSG